MAPDALFLAGVLVGVMTTAAWFKSMLRPPQ